MSSSTNNYPTRLAIFNAIPEAGCNAQAIAVATGLHINTVFTYLRAMKSDGCVEIQPQAGQGKPNIYFPLSTPLPPHEERQYAAQLEDALERIILTLSRFEDSRETWNDEYRKKIEEAIQQSVDIAYLALSPERLDSLSEKL